MEIEDIASDIDKILLDKWNSKTVFDTSDVNIPELCIFNNTAYAIDLLHEHIRRNSVICLHTDVDVDGIGSTLIMKRELENLCSRNHILLINKDKIHGIQQKHADYFNTNKKIDLMIITDSSSNEIDIIKQFNCDVLCIDHHELLHNDLLGFCNDGEHRYVIINNNIDNTNFEFDKSWLVSKNPKTFLNINNYLKNGNMSCAEVVYELLNVYNNCFGCEDLLSNLRMYQWVAITLFTDAINTLNSRNQYYITKAFNDDGLESGLKDIIKVLNPFSIRLTKSLISYTFAPVINKAIRAGESAKALDIVVNRPKDIGDLKKYGDAQDDAINKATKVVRVDPDTGIEQIENVTFIDDNIMYDIGKLNIHPNYSGVIAGRLAGENNKNAAVYITLPDGTCKGSFRGRQKDTDYRKYFADYSDDIYAQGHPQAFGFKLQYEQLKELMNNISKIEDDIDDNVLFSLGSIEENNKGTYHIDNLQRFKQAGALFKIANGNSKVNGTDEVFIRINAADLLLKNTRGKLYEYSLLGGIEKGGMECKAFKPIDKKYCNLYLEYSNQLEIFIK